MKLKEEGMDGWYAFPALICYHPTRRKSKEGGMKNGIKEEGWTPYQGHMLTPVTTSSYRHQETHTYTLTYTHTDTYPRSSTHRRLFKVEPK